jgi:hypothetical protein
MRILKVSFVTVFTLALVTPQIATAGITAALTTLTPISAAKPSGPSGSPRKLVGTRTVPEGTVSLYSDGSVEAKPQTGPTVYCMHPTSTGCSSKNPPWYCKPIKWLLDQQWTTPL